MSASDSYVLEPSWPGDVAELRDEPCAAEVLHRAMAFSGRVWDIVTDDVALTDGQTVTRDFVAHTGAVGVIALDDRDRVLLIRQYRHPVASLLWEPVAGLLDVDGEPPLRAAQRELIEEAGLVAEHWSVLLDQLISPGGSSEVFRCFLARGLRPAPGGRPVGEGEERDMPWTWVPLDQAVDSVLAGRLGAPITVTGILSAAAAKARGWTTLRSAESPWPAYDIVTVAGRRRGASGLR